MLKLRTQWARRSAVFVTGVVTSAALMIALSAAPASAATIDYAHPGTSCVGDHDVLHWEPQSVPGLLGYQVEQWVQQLDIPVKYLVTQVGPTVTSLPFVVQTGNGIGNTFFVKTITAAGVSEPFDVASALSQVPPVGFSLQFAPASTSVGNHRATVTFVRSPMDKFTDFATSVAMTASPPGGRATILDGIGFQTRFDGLRNGTPYRFTAVGTNACGTGEASPPSYMSVVPGLIHITTPAALPAGAVGMPYIERLKATGGCSDKALCSSLRVQWGVTSGTTPPGMRLLGTGQLEGVPTTAGSFTFTVTASAACGCISDRPTKTFTIQVGPSRPAIVSSATPPVAGQAVTFTVAMPRAATVNFFDGATLLATKASSYGKAALHTKLGAGSHSISVTFTPRGSLFEYAVPAFVQQVDPAPTAVTLTARPQPAPLSRMVTFTAHVKRLAPATGRVAGGTVSLYDDDILLATLPAVNGIAVFKTNALGTGTHPMTAVFNGSSDEQSSSTAVIDVVIA